MWTFHTISWVWLGLSRSSWFGLGCGHSPSFGYKGETSKPRSVLVTGVRPVSLWPLIIESNLGAWSCLDVV
jgi:hypothetical protein